jgi:hypothetical protein
VKYKSRLLLTEWEREWLIQMADCVQLSPYADVSQQKLEVFTSWLHGAKVSDLCRKHHKGNVDIHHFLQSVFDRIEWASKITVFKWDERKR